jgi:hypothetical protein
MLHKLYMTVVLVVHRVRYLMGIPVMNPHPMYYALAKHIRTY